MVSFLPNPPPPAASANLEVAAALVKIADLLERQAANPFRIAAYRAAASAIGQLQRSVVEIVELEGTEGLLEIPGVGKSIARSIRQWVKRGRMRRLEQLQEERSGDVLTSLPSIGPLLAGRIRATLGIDSLEEVFAAAYDGRLRQVAGVGQKRIQLIRECLAARIGPRGSAPRVSPKDAPPVALLLDIDRIYRERAGRGELTQVAPRQFNPTGAAWLPVMRIHRDESWYGAMYSNTARAHQLGHVGDWVVIYRDGPGGYGQWTVITSRFGRARGKRIVRGREAECLEHYRTAVTQPLLWGDMQNG